MYQLWLKQLGIPTYFLTLLFADLRWDELPYIINKFNNLGHSDKELIRLSYQDSCIFYNNNPVLLARLFQYKVEAPFKEIIIDCPVLLRKQNIMLFLLNFKKGVAHTFIHLHGFSIHQILKKKLPTQRLLRKQQMHSCRTM